MSRTLYTLEIQSAATSHGLSFALLEAQVLQESSGHADAFRYEPVFYTHYIKGMPAAKAGAYGPLDACSYGLLQIMLETAAEMGFTGRPEDLFTPAVGLEWGARKMRALWDAAGGTDSAYHVALAAYNGGPALLHATSLPPGPAAYANNIYRLVNLGGV